MNCISNCVGRCTCTHSNIESSTLSLKTELSNFLGLINTSLIDKIENIEVNEIKISISNIETDVDRINDYLLLIERRLENLERK